MTKRTNLIYHILFFGSLWGILELVADRLIGIPAMISRASVLTTIAIFVLVLARQVENHPGSTFAIGLVAAFFKFLNVPFWGCQVFALLLLGGVFEVGFLLRNRYELRRSTTALLLALLVYVDFVLFALFVRYLLQNPWWVNGGWERFWNYVGISGTLTAGFSAPAMFLGIFVAKRWRDSIMNFRIYHAATYHFTCAVSILLATGLSWWLR